MFSVAGYHHMLPGKRLGGNHDVGMAFMRRVLCEERMKTVCAGVIEHGHLKLLKHLPCFLQQRMGLRSLRWRSANQATTLTLSGISVEGSILAPFAHVDNPQGVILGTIIAASWNGPMQQNHQPFTGDLPCEEPEPGSITVFKYNDLNNSGQYDQESESGLQGWEFTIGNESQTTDSNGKATFDNLVAGQEYEVCETFQTGWLNTDPSDGSGCKTMIAGSSSTETVMFGNYQVKGVEITKYQRLDDSDEWIIDPLCGLMPDDTFSYQISVENLYYEEDLGMEIFDILSDHIEFTDGSLVVEKADTTGTTEFEDNAHYDFTYDRVTRELALDYNSILLSGELLKLSFDVMVADDFDPGMVIENMAEVAFTGQDRITSNIVEAYSVPEPGTVFLLGIGLVGLLGFGKKFRKN
jgi:hypothetical protein